MIQTMEVLFSETWAMAPRIISKYCRVTESIINLACFRRLYCQAKEKLLVDEGHFK